MNSQDVSHENSRQHKLRSWLLLLFIFIVIPLGALAVLWRDACVTTRQSEFNSPAGDFVASIHATDCHGRLKPAMEVRIERREASGSTTATEQILLYQGTEAPRLNWMGPTTLQVTYPKGVEVVTRRAAYAGLTIELVEPSS